MKFQFYVKFHTRHGQSLLIGGNIAELGNNDPEGALSMVYLNNDYWQGTLEMKRKVLPKDFTYKYILKNEDGELLYEWGNDRCLEIPGKEVNEVQLIDTWNHAGEFENAFFTTPFKEVFLTREIPKKKKEEKHGTHIFKVKAPLLKKHECLCLLGASKPLHDWDTSKPIMLHLEGHWWTGKISLSGSDFPVAYKYGVYDTKENKFIVYEGGNNRLVFSEPGKKKITVLHDGFAQLPNNTWKGSGIAIPVFSLRSKNSFGVGEFTDIKLLVDWVAETGIKLVQLLPVNDTIATNTWMDSYPYAAISAFALHPIYINLAKVSGKKGNPSLRKKQKQLNALEKIDYEEVVKFKISVLRELYEVSGKEALASDAYQSFLKENKHWLQPYAAFCYFRDKYGTTNFSGWPASDKNYNKENIEKLFSEKSPLAKQTGFYCFTQFHLHGQLKEAADYAHKKGVVLKGDIPIGVYMYGCDAWVAPELYNMNWQAGAPPDDFTAVGQNWSFPTYNWKKMQEDGFAWWKQRFEQMSYYFDAFRIDHILGFFRIWSIPDNAVQGILGRFIPCIPVHINEFGENGIWFDYQRFCRPYISDEVLEELFGETAENVKENFLEKNESGGYNLCTGFETQLQVEKYFTTVESTTENERLKLGLYDLISNVILLEDKQSPGEEFHFRISMEKTLSYKYLIPHVQEKLKTLYVNYFYRRQDKFWFKEAMHKLPKLKAATNMLVCGEDLGMVPHCVPEVMQQLGILSLEIQRMPKDPLKEFFHPDDAPYMSVITPSTHDMSTIRAWWEENPGRTQQFYNTILAQHGEAPSSCEDWINRAIVLQHLYSPAMWSIFQLQDILGMNDKLKRENPKDERINNPANPNNYWQYRMHILLEDLLKEKEFNAELKGYVENSGRGE